MKKQNTKPTLPRCPGCHSNGTFQQFAVVCNLKAGKAMAHYRCARCGMTMIQFRYMTEDELTAERARLAAEQERARLAAEDKAREEAAEQDRMDRERAEIILALRRARRGN